uniref:F-box/LRR-repeat protein 5 n=1 Tax=Pyxicephalus adspersus TaxID=30357 RepID=A0AAV3B2H1_PYXAD|nr:TPA: hypothetical protein GDO54_009540 [Pyxicephalus adspersus]
MAPFPDEVDVFTGPHWRMKQLVGRYCDKDEYEQLNYAQQLKERLEAFTSDFIPHMKEEEEVFQPMLMEYFTYDELKDIKKMVIAQHCSQKDPSDLLRGLSLWSEAEELQKVLKYSVDEKAEEGKKAIYLLWYFGHCQSLQNVDLSGCEKITDKALERLSIALGVLPSYKKSLLKCCQNSKNSKTSWGSRAMSHRMRTSSVQCIGGQCVLSYGGDYTTSPVWILDSESLADIEDAADWKYKHDGPCVLDMSSSLNCINGGCCIRKPISGLRTSVSWQQQYYSSSYSNCGHSFCSAGAKLRTIQALPESSALCNTGKRTPQSEVRDSYSGSADTEFSSARVLQFLSLSGCHQITDRGLRALTFGGGLPNLEHLNLSGCLNVTASGLQDLVSACPSLNDEHFYYCDNINGPHADTASGCQNLQCGFRACCRSGE